MFDPEGTFAVRQMLQSHSTIFQYTSLNGPNAPLILNGGAMSPSEQNAKSLLDLAHPNQVNSHVALSSIFTLNASAMHNYFVNKFTTVQTKHRSSCINKVATSLIQNKEADFIIKAAGAPIAFCLEVDGPSHQNEPQQTCDLTKNALFHAYQVPLYRVTNAEIASAHSALLLGQLGPFQNLLLTASARWITYTLNPCLQTMQLHNP